MSAQNIGKIEHPETSLVLLAQEGYNTYSTPGTSAAHDYLKDRVDYIFRLSTDKKMLILSYKLPNTEAVQDCRIIIRVFPTHKVYQYHVENTLTSHNSIAELFQALGVVTQKQESQQQQQTAFETKAVVEQVVEGEVRQDLYTEEAFHADFAELAQKYRNDAASPEICKTLRQQGGAFLCFRGIEGQKNCFTFSSSAPDKPYVEGECGWENFKAYLKVGDKNIIKPNFEAVFNLIFKPFLSVQDKTKLIITTKESKYDYSFNQFKTDVQLRAETGWTEEQLNLLAKTPQAVFCILMPTQDKGVYRCSSKGWKNDKGILIDYVVHAELFWKEGKVIYRELRHNDKAVNASEVMYPDFISCWNTLFVTFKKPDDVLDIRGFIPKVKEKVPRYRQAPQSTARQSQVVELDLQQPEEEDCTLILDRVNAKFCHTAFSEDAANRELEKMTEGFVCRLRGDEELRDQFVVQCKIANKKEPERMIVMFHGSVQGLEVYSVMHKQSQFGRIFFPSFESMLEFVLGKLYKTAEQREKDLKESVAREKGLETKAKIEEAKKKAEEDAHKAALARQQEIFDQQQQQFAQQRAAELKHQQDLLELEELKRKNEAAAALQRQRSLGIPQGQSQSQSQQLPSFGRANSTGSMNLTPELLAQYMVNLGFGGQHLSSMLGSDFGPQRTMADYVKMLEESIEYVGVYNEAARERLTKHACEFYLLKPTDTNNQTKKLYSIHFINFPNLAIQYYIEVTDRGFRFGIDQEWSISCRDLTKLHEEIRNRFIKPNMITSKSAGVSMSMSSSVSDAQPYGSLSVVKRYAPQATSSLFLSDASRAATGAATVTSTSASSSATMVSSTSAAAAVTATVSSASASNGRASASSDSAAALSSVPLQTTFVPGRGFVVGGEPEQKSALDEWELIPDQGKAERTATRAEGETRRGEFAEQQQQQQGQPQQQVQVVQQQQLQPQQGQSVAQQQQQPLQQTAVTSTKPGSSS